MTSSIKEVTGKLHLKNSQIHLEEAVSEDDPFEVRSKGWRGASWFREGTPKKWHSA